MSHGFQTYRETEVRLARIQELCQISSFYSPMLQTADSFYSQEIIGRFETLNTEEDQLDFIEHFMMFMRFTIKDLHIQKEIEYDRSMRWLAAKHVLERDYVMSQEQISPKEFGIKLLIFGIAWLLHEMDILSLKSFRPKEVVAAQGSVHPTVIYNFIPVDVFFNGQNISTVPPNHVLGEGGFFQVPRTAEIRIPVTKDASDDPCIAILDCAGLKETMPKLYDAYRLEVFIAFLEKLQKSNARRWTERIEMRKLGLTLETPPPTKPKTQISFDPIETLWNSPLFAGMTDPETMDQTRMTLEQIAKVETYHRGESIIPIHADPEKLFVIHSGTASIRGAREERFATVQAGHIVGESIITGTPTIAEVVCEDDEVVTCGIDKQDLLDSPIRSIIFHNCFRVLQEKLISNDLQSIETRRKIHEHKTKSASVKPEPVKEPIQPKTEEDDEPSPFAIKTDLLNPEFESMSGRQESSAAERVKPPRTPSNAATKAKRSVPKVTEEEPPPLRGFTARISASLKHWLGENFEEKSNREMTEILDDLQKRMNRGEIKIRPHK